MSKYTDTTYRYNMPYNKKQAFDEENRKQFRKARNRAMNDVFSKYGIPQNMGNKEIKRRVKYHNWLARKAILHAHARKQKHPVRLPKGWPKNKIWIHNKYIEFLMNDKVFNENKRKDLVVLALQLNDAVLMAVRSPVVVSYLVKLVNLVPDAQYFTRQLKSFGKFREDAAMIAMLKKRINFLRKLRREYDDVMFPVNVVTNLRPVLDRLNIPVNIPVNNQFISIRNLNRLMDDMFPIPPPTKGNAATKIQKTVRGMRNRKKLTTMRKAATTIQKRARGMINRTTVKKMKTVAGRVSLRGKRKRSPQ
tara:strand:- start:907 stop:1824 length:918 start_codon:yes stop_codon:yes gene_type:complete